MNTTTKMGNFYFDNCLMNASGVNCATVEELEELVSSQAGSLVSKTATLEAREGNPSPRFKSNDWGSINSMGLPNMGIEYYLEYLIGRQAEEGVKTAFLSVTELNKDNIYQVMQLIEDSDYQGLTELNLSCPNVPGEPQVGYDFDLVQEILSMVFSYFTKPLGVKLPPYFDMAHFDKMAAILNQFPLTFINSVNSIGNGLWIEDESVVIKPKQGFGGIGGQYIKATALANVHGFYQRLKPEIQIIGTGGVYTGQDAFEHILCGASMVQMGSALAVEGVGIFARITEELQGIMADKGYGSLEDFRGKLKYIN